MKILMLRQDFNQFIDDLEDKSLFKKSLKNFEGKTVEIWDIDFKIAFELFSNYIEKIKKSILFNQLTKNDQDNFYQIAHEVIIYSYLDGRSNKRIKNGIFSNTVMFDNTANYPNITSGIYDKEIFWKIFNDAFYKNMDETIKKYGKDPKSIVIGGNRIDEIPKHLPITATEPKICQIVFDDTTEKQEIIDFINKEWGSIDAKLKALRPKREKERITTSSNFLRDVEIYNKYIDCKNQGYKNPDIKTWVWLKNESEFKIEIEPNTITKIVSLMNLEIKNINTEK